MDISSSGKLRINAQLKEVNYAPLFKKTLARHSLRELRAGELAGQSSCLLSINNDLYGFSQWVSPKRTRSFPYARVYDTLQVKNRITLIPFCKDEGADGDRDFIQWDTIALMSLLNAHVIIGFYCAAEKNNRPAQARRRKITNQQYDYKHVARQARELAAYQSSALHWNLKQIDGIARIGRQTQRHYAKISADVGVEMHGADGIAKRTNIIAQGAEEFRKESRMLSQQAQRREMQTTQPKEKVSGAKASITLSNLLGGMYHLTADEYLIIGKTLFLIEMKHSAHKKLPSQDDMKDAFIKMALFGNIRRGTGQPYRYRAVVGLTSAGITGVLHSAMSDSEIKGFIRANALSDAEAETALLATREAKRNNFILFARNADDVALQKKILAKFA